MGGGDSGARLSGKGTRPSYQRFSGNAVSLVLMSAVRHSYRPVAANEGGGKSLRPSPPEPNPAPQGCINPYGPLQAQGLWHLAPSNGRVGPPDGLLRLSSPHRSRLFLPATPSTPGRCGDLRRLDVV